MLKTFVNPQIHTFSLFSYWLKVPHTEKNNPERGKEGGGEMERGGGVGPNETTENRKVWALEIKAVVFSPIEL